MFEHIRKKFPWRIRKEKQCKEEFVKKLQESGHGQPKIRFKDTSKIPDGALIMIHDYRDGSTLTAIYFNHAWITYGTDGRPTTMSSVELEDMLTEKRNLASKKDKLIILDKGGLLNIDYSTDNSLAGFSKMSWQDIGNDEIK